MEQVNEIGTVKGIKYWILESARKEKGISYAQMEELISIAEGTCKNILTGKTKSPGVDTLDKICNFFSIPIKSVLYGNTEEDKTAIEFKGIKDGDISVIALKEIYEKQLSEKDATNEKHTTEIRAHYEQHHNDLKDNYEKRLADKREINDAKDQTIELLKAQVAERDAIIKKYEEKEKETDQIKDLKKSNRVKSIIIGVLVVGALLLEFIFAERGWLRF